MATVVVWRSKANWWRSTWTSWSPLRPTTPTVLPTQSSAKRPLTRIGLAPKQVRIYRNGSEIRSRKLHPVEVFAGTGQVVAFGWHARAGRPYLWPLASPLEISADSDQVPTISRAQLDRFTSELFAVVPRRLMPTRQGRPNGFHAAQTIGERLRMLTTLHGSWRHAVAIILGEAVEGCRNETGWAVIASAAGRGVPEDVLWQLFTCEDAPFRPEKASARVDFGLRTHNCADRGCADNWRV